MLNTQAKLDAQQKFKIFKDNWPKEEKKRTPLIFHNDSFDNKTPSTMKSLVESFMGKGRSKKNTINPAFVPGKREASPGSSATKPRIIPKTLFINLDEISNAGNKPLCLQTDSKLASKPKRKCVSARNERYEKLLKLRNSSSGFKSSSESGSSVRNLRSSSLPNHSAISKITDNADLSHYDFTINEDMPEKKMRRKRTSFHLKSPKLFPNKKSKTSNRTTDSSAAASTGNDYDMETNEITSSELSFPVYQSRFKNSSVNIQEDYPEISTPSKYDYTSCTEEIYSSPKMKLNPVLSWILPLNNVSECDTTTFSDDDISSVGFSPLCCGTPLESTCSSASDVEMRMSNSMILPTTPQNCIRGSSGRIHKQPNFSSDSSAMKEKSDSFSPKRENRLPFKKRQTQWCDFLDSLDSALTTSMEKLKDIRDNL